MRSVIVTLCVLGGLSLAAADRVSADDLSDCNSTNLDKRIPACTRLIFSLGVLDRPNLAIVHNNRAALRHART